jgi:hypothetical protein
MDSRSSLTDSEKKILAELYPNTSTALLAAKFGRSINFVYRTAYVMGLKKTKEFISKTVSDYMKDPNNRANEFKFKKGQTPANKGKKISQYLSPELIEKLKVTQFKKGQMPHNKKPVGYERINADGYAEIKVSEPNVFKLKHRVLFEKENGPIPKGYNVQFADGNPLNFAPENLYLIHRSQQIRVNTIYNYPKDVIKAIKLVSKLKKLTNETN